MPRSRGSHRPSPRLSFLPALVSASGFASSPPAFPSPTFRRCLIPHQHFIVALKRSKTPSCPFYALSGGKAGKHAVAPPQLTGSVSLRVFPVPSGGAGAGAAPRSSASFITLPGVRHSACRAPGAQSVSKGLLNEDAQHRNFLEVLTPALLRFSLQHFICPFSARPVCYHSFRGCMRRRNANYSWMPSFE